MSDFFVSYTHVDKRWAEWISYTLEDKGFSVLVQAWDFRPGSNFVLEMQRAAEEAERTILVLSPDYLQSQFASPEWAAAFAHDPQGLNLKLVPVMVRACTPKGLLTQIVQIRIADLDEAAAKQELLQGVDRKRAKPSSAPAFPGSGVAPAKAFPGDEKQNVAQSPARPNVIPSLNRNPTDIDKRRFIKEGFVTITNYFEANLLQASQQEARIETDFQARTNTDFRAELFVDGNSKCVCRIWQGGMHSDNNICYSESSMSDDNSCNEIISLIQDDSLAFKALMDMGHFGQKTSFSTENMTPEQTAEYLWQRFVARLGYS